MQQALTPFHDIIVGGIEIVCIPGIGYVTGIVGIVQEEMDFMIWIIRDNPFQISDVVLLHAKKEIVFIIIRCCHLPRMPAGIWNMLLIQLTLCRWIHIIAQFLS